jgi:8-oxo-dGTP pyrophosphatase MutT (NUDIX family)
MIKGAGILFITKDKGELKFLLGKRLDFPRVWSIPAGGRDKGEDRLTNAIREVEEEISIVVDKDISYYKKFNIDVSLLYDWSTFVAYVDKETFDKNFKLVSEFSEMDWFTDAPKNTHILLTPIINKIKKNPEDYTSLKLCPIYPKKKKKIFYSHYRLRNRRPR